MADSGLGRLKRVELADVWSNEATDFTPWLASDENIELLGEVLGLELEVESIEKDVGPFRADVLCKDTASDRYVLIENQLTQTDHSHLGQLVTYAAGLDAAVVVWIASRFTDEHRASVDWLNGISHDDVSFFALEVELWQIGNSQPAPKFNVAAQPNEWTRSIETKRDLSDTQQLQLEFWTRLRQVQLARDGIVRPVKPAPQNWQTYGVGRSDFHVYASMNTQKKTLSVGLGLVGASAKAHFHLLREQEAAIEADLGSEVRWELAPQYKMSWVSHRLTDVALDDRGRWPELHAWVAERLDAFHKAFSSRVKALNAADWQPEDD